MSGGSGRVKNPLLSAAGDNFSFENYAENTLLVPVTPATPAVLRDDPPELDNFIGQEPIAAQHPNLSGAQLGTNIELVPNPVPSEEVKNLSSAPPKQGYLTSILSSLPNLSLSSITGDSSASQVGQGLDNSAKNQNTSPFVPSLNPRNPLSNSTSNLVISPQETTATNFSSPSEVNLGGVGQFSTPPQPSLPPTAPLTSDGSVSYRLGNQRRLKYAPPPDLTSNTTKQYPTPAVPNFFTPPNPSAAPTIFNPNESTSHVPNYNPIETQSVSISQVGQYSEFNQFSQNSSLQGSYRSSPVATGSPYSATVTPRSITPQNQASYYEPTPSALGRPRVSLSCSKSIPSHPAEPATPQNTPANVSFPGFDLYLSQRNFSGTPTSESEEIAARDQKKQGLQTFQASSPGSGCETKTDGSLSSGNANFKPISADKVTEKLECLLKEQKDRSTDSPRSLQTEELQPSVTDSSPASFQQGDREEVQKTEPLSTSNLLSDVYLGKEEVKEGPQASEDTIKESQEPLITVPLQETPATFSTTENFFTENKSSGKQSLNYTTHADSAAVPKFFADTQTKASLNYIPTTETSTVNYSNVSKVFEQSASSFFDSTEHSETFPTFQSAQKGSDTAPIIIKSQNTPEHHREDFSIKTSPADSTIPLPQTLWHSNVPQSESINPGYNNSIQPPPPVFYNPSQFPPKTYKQPATESATPSIGHQVNPGHQYFNNFSASQQLYNTTTTQSPFFEPISTSSVAKIPEPTGTATLSPVQVSLNPLTGRHTPDTVPPSLQNLAVGPSERRMQYRPVYHHWFYRKEVEHKVLWQPFSMLDSLQLEEVHNSSEITPETVVATDGGRYDVNILRRQRTPVYWSGAPTEVRRCSWFFKGHTESRYIPYDENTAAKLEEEFKQACHTNNWNRRIDLSNGEFIIFDSATVQVHYSQPASPELATSWGNMAGSEDSAYLQGAANRPRVIKRGHDEFHIEDGEPEKVDHLLFLVHGIGSVCDLKFRSVEEVVDEFRSISLQLVQSHYRTASEQRVVNRIEVLPISWHTTLHSEDTGIDKKLQSITLESIPKLRHFTNDTLLDILFYTSPIYCQTIIQTVGNELNRLCTLFRERNPSFDGSIYLGGHSLGSLILFDLLCHQKPLTDKNSEDTEKEEGEEKENDDETSKIKPLPAPVLKRRLSKRISYVMGAAGTGQPYIHYPQLTFNPRAFFALGSPIGMFVTVRGIDTLGENFSLPTCPAFFNIFHPFDPVAYRVESLIDPDAHKYRPMLIPHHKGRKRMHLELKETMARVGADLKQRLIDSVRSTWNSVYQLALFHRPDPQTLEEEIDKVVEEQLQKQPTIPEQQSQDDGGADFKVGMLNGGRRIDYVLQEAPLEYINEYIFALTSHVCYWESEDTMLMILKEVYGSSGIQTDAQLPQQTMTVERASSSQASPVLSPTGFIKNDLSSPVSIMGIDPTAPMTEKPVGPPPKTGFVRKS